jgi:hypothetical protein
MMSAAQRSVIALRYSRSLSRAVLAKARGDRSLPTQVRFNIGDQIFYYRGLNKNKSQWSQVWHGPAVIVGFEGEDAWVSHRSTVLKCAGHRSRAATPEEQIPL